MGELKYAFRLCYTSPHDDKLSRSIPVQHAHTTQVALSPAIDVDFDFEPARQSAEVSRTLFPPIQPNAPDRHSRPNNPALLSRISRHKKSQPFAGSATVLGRNRKLHQHRSINRRACAVQVILSQIAVVFVVVAEPPNSSKAPTLFNSSRFYDCLNLNPDKSGQID